MQADLMLRTTADGRMVPVKVRLVIPGSLPGLNEYVDACRAHKQAGARMKKDAEEVVAWALRTQLRGETLPEFEGKVKVTFTWVEPDLRRDPDNIAFAKKFILDVLGPQTKRNPNGWGIIKSDGRRHVLELEDRFPPADKAKPHIEVLISDREEGGE